MLLALCESLMVNLSPLHISEQREKATSRIKQLNKPKSKKFLRFFFFVYCSTTTLYSYIDINIEMHKNTQRFHINKDRSIHGICILHTNICILPPILKNAQNKNDAPAEQKKNKMNNNSLGLIPNFLEISSAVNIKRLLCVC